MHTTRGFIVLSLALLGFGLGQLAGATTYLIHADGSGDFPNLQAAIDGASPGDIIEMSLAAARTANAALTGINMNLDSNLTSGANDITGIKVAVDTNGTGAAKAIEILNGDFIWIPNGSGDFTADASDG